MCIKMTFHATILFFRIFLILYFSIKVSIFALVGLKIKEENVLKTFLYDRSNMQGKSTAVNTF